MPSPTCEVRDGAGPYQSTEYGVDVTPGNVVTIRLADQTDVDSWTIACLTTDELSDKDTVNALLVIDSATKTATFSVPVSFGQALRFVSRINNGKDANYIERDDFTTTLCIYALSVNGLRVLAVDEQLEGNPDFGWITSFNTFIRTPPSGEINTASNVGVGAQVYKEKVGGDLRLRTLVAGTGVGVSEGVDEITIASTALPAGATTEVQTKGAGPDEFVAASGVTAGAGFLTLAVGADVVGLDANTGAVTIGVGTGYLSIGAASLAQSGQIRVPNATRIVVARDAAGAADLVVLETTNGNNLFIGSNSGFASAVSQVNVVGSFGVALFSGGGSLHQYMFNDLTHLGVPVVGYNTPYSVHGEASQAMADANQTPDGSIYSRSIIKCTGTLTANRTLTLPLAGSADRSYFKTIWNATSGGFSIIVTDGAGTSVIVLPGESVTVFVDTAGVRRADTADPSVNGTRLTLTASTAVATSDVTGATTVRLTPYMHGEIAVNTGAVWARLRVSSDVTLSLGTLASATNYDVFAYINSSGAVALELGPAWTNNTTRSTGLTRQDGVYVKSGAATRRYLGTIRTTSTTTTEDSAAKRFVWNMYNRVERALVRKETASSWTYATAAYRAANNNTANCVEFVTGDPAFLELSVATKQTGTANGWGASVGLGFDSSTTNNATIYGGLTSFDNVDGYGFYNDAEAHYRGSPAVGYHIVYWTEASGGITITFYGTLGNTTFFQFGIYGFIQA